MTNYLIKTIASLLIKFRKLLAENIKFETKVIISRPSIIVKINKTLISRKNNP